MIYTVSHKYITDESDRNWLDDKLQLMDGPHHKVGRVFDIWPKMLPFELNLEAKVNDVIFNPNGLVYSKLAVKRLEKLSSLIEWLPVSIIGMGECYVLHPSQYVEFPLSSTYLTNSVSKNVVEVSKFDFGVIENLPDLFLVKQIKGSAAEKAGYGLREVFVMESAYQLFNEIDGIALKEIA